MALVAGGGLIAASETTVSAHPFPTGCGTVLLPSLGAAAQQYWNTGLAGNAVTAMNRAHNNHSADTDMGWTVGGSSGASRVRWDYMNNPDVDLAGQSGVVWGANCLITAHSVWLNSPHLATVPDTIGEKQCIAVHELGHSVGLSHSNQTAAATGLAEHAVAVTVMRGGEHAARCHVASPPLRLRSADIADINAKY